MLDFVSVASHPEYVAPKMLSFLKSHELTDKIQVAQIDPQYADGEKLSEAYGVDICRMPSLSISWQNNSST